jgi:site-specific recombinase XerD
MTPGPFISQAARELEEFLAYKRGLGRYDNETVEFRLRSFDRFAAQHADRTSKHDLHEVVARWLSRNEARKTTTVRNELILMRQFGRFLERRNRTRFVLNPDRLPRLPNRRSHTAHVLSRDEIRLLIRETRTMRPSFRAFTFGTMLLAMYCTGLRPGEAVRLTLGDLDLRARTFFIRKSKNKSRWLPFHEALARKLRKYIELRRTISPATPDAALFVQPNGHPYNAQASARVLCGLFRRAGLKPPRGRVGPRPYDLRHAFAVNCLTRWYREGADLHARLPWLSAYMGHKGLLGTEWYLKATPELLRFASRRFAARFHRRERP